MPCRCPRPATAAVAALVALAVALRTRALDAGYWIDEGLAVGIASHPLRELPGLLAGDGSPPLWYAGLHGWVALAGEGEAATRWPSVAAAAACVPAAFWVGRLVDGPRCGLAAAALAAVAPFLTVYGQETRMYALVALLSLVATGSLVGALAHGRRRLLPALAASVAALLWTHTWSLHLLVGLAVAVAVLARAADAPRRVLRDGALALGAAVASFLPWLPTLVAQARETGAPWARTPAPWAAASGLLEPLATGLVAAAAAAVAIVGLRRAARVRADGVVAALAACVAATATSGYVASLASPSWANRYLAVVLGPLLALAACGLLRAGRPGLVALGGVLVASALTTAPAVKSNVREEARATAPLLRPGDAVVVAHPEQVAVLSLYLPPGLAYATTLGPVDDPRRFDWRHALDRLERRDAAADAARAAAALPRGGRLAVLYPVALPARSWRAPWLEAVRTSAATWERTLAGSPRLIVVRDAPAPAQGLPRTAVRVVVYEAVAG